MNLPPKYTEALSELINVAYGRAAKSLSELTKQRILLEVPRLEVHFLSEMKTVLQRLYSEEVWSVHQSFAGGMSGHAVLLVDEKSARALAAQMLGRDPSAPHEAEVVQEALTEAGNIVLQAALGICGELLHIQVAFSVPGLRVETLSKMLASIVVSQNELQYALLVRTRFQVLSKDIVGNMVVVLGMTSFTRLIVAIDAWEKRGLRRP
ncbi:MAG TPA: chemotaxis protein CheX [Verrucomicrobiae bacterium]|nr:chemotaxis protein CheX [Verrucomicrobiae bacterium]